MTMRSVAVLTLSLLAAAGSSRADTDIPCQAIELPGMPDVFVEAWQVNNQGDVALFFETETQVGTGIYSTLDGTFDLLPDASAFGYVVGALGINDAGVVAGIAESDDPVHPERGFILVGDQYIFLDAPFGSPQTEPRAISDTGLVSGINLDSDGVGPGFVYNPGRATHPYPPGFTEILPTLNGEASYQVITGQINANGQLVGSARFNGVPRWGFLYDPRAPEPYQLFQVNGHRTAARGINNQGTIVGFTGQGDLDVGFVRSAGSTEIFHCVGLDNFPNVYPQSINDHGVIAGQVQDADGNTRGFIAHWPR
jgi:hypothetical protein